MMGYIMKKRQMAIGIDTCATEILSKYPATSGAALPRPMPAAMHRSTQPVRYFSKMVRAFASLLHFIAFILSS
jgi:hypothetical protein